MYVARLSLPLGVLTLTAIFGLGAPVAAQDSGPALDDARIAHVAVTANAIDVEIAALAEDRAADERVHRFAATMITDHTAVNAQAGALAKRLGVTPADNDISRSLRSGATAAAAELRKLDGRAFDRAYMAREVGYHRAVLTAVDETLIPATRNAELKALLQQARSAIAAHLAHAEMLQKALGSGA